MRLVAAAALALGGAGCVPRVDGAAAGSAAPTSAPAVGPELAAPGGSLGAAEYGWLLTDPTGRTVRFSAFRGRTVLLNLWATWCPPCVAELGSLARLRDSLAAGGDTARVAVVLVSPEAPETVGRFLARHRIPIASLVERTRTPAAYGVRALPTTVIVSPDGRIVFRHRGAAAWDDPAVMALLREVAAGER